MSEETFAKYTDRQNLWHLFYYTCANEWVTKVYFGEIFAKTRVKRDTRVIWKIAIYKE